MSDLPKRPRAPEGDEPDDTEADPGPSEAPETEAPEGTVVPPTAPTPTTMAASEEVAEWQRRFQYLLADFDNYRRRVERERQAAVESARGNILLRTIDLHDGLETALHDLPEDTKGIKTGLALVLKNFDQLLDDEKIKPVATVGKPFDPEVHEAVGQVPATDDQPDGTVAAIIQQGYRGPVGLMRAAKVMVARAPSGEPEAEAPTSQA